MINLVLGGPGCGKTTRLLEIMERELEGGIPASRIAFVAFTRAAAQEARQRAAAKFGLDPEQDLPWFRTIHSLVYAQLDLTKDDLIGRKDLEDLCQLLSLPFPGTIDEELTIPGIGANQLTVFMRICDYAVTTGRTLRETWEGLNEPVSWYALKQFDDTYTQLKADLGKLDFTDTLRIYAQGEGQPVNIDVAIIDEAQDLTALQWRVVERALGAAQRWYVGGDDDQALYTWAGADLEHFLHLSRSPEVLPVSHRLPMQIWSLAMERASHISRRYKKPFAPATDEDVQALHYHHTPNLNLSDLAPREDTWLVLARNTYLMQRWIGILRQQGIPYTVRGASAIQPDHATCIARWPAALAGEPLTAQEVRTFCKVMDMDVPQLRETQTYTNLWQPKPWPLAFHGITPRQRDYYQACQENGYNLTRPPAVRIDTIHGVKGMEADHTLIMSDMSSRTYRSMHLDPDAEHRVWYVGLTRSRKSLHVVLPQSDMSYSL